MSDRNSELLQFYKQHRIDDQLTYYTSRVEQFDRATGQGLAVSAMLLGFASAAGALAGTALAWAQGWSATAAILSAASTTLAAYISLYAFEQQSKIYGDAVRAVRGASRPALAPGGSQDGPPSEDDVTELVRRAETVFRQEQAQWGQLTSQIQITDQAGG